MDWLVSDDLCHLLTELRLFCRRLREQARSHSGSLSNTKFVSNEDQMWERACSRRGHQPR
ncbi:hypothetical protein C0J26_00870 [Pseudomonas baetica]|nr:hypothetical protein C0J26_00870 [Pseudomonas baetica]